MLKDFAIQGCVFDFDGTVVLSEHIHMQAYEFMAKSFGLALPPGFLDTVVGYSDQSVIAKLAGLWEFKYSVEEIYDRKADFYRGQSEHTCELVAGVREALKEISAQVPIALATNSSLADVDPILTAHDLKKYFKSLHTFETVTSPKPHPEIYLNAAESLGCSPGSCLAFEDSIAGVTAVRASGTRLISVGTIYDAKALGPAWRHIKSFEDDTVRDLWT